jgi:hypothetical protein
MVTGKKRKRNTATDTTATHTTACRAIRITRKTASIQSRVFDYRYSKTGIRITRMVAGKKRKRSTARYKLTKKISP